MSQRQPIPAEIRREVLVEAGHRCSIQQCRSAADIDIHHIVPWEECRKHEAANLIVLCPNCHRLADRGKIDRKSLFKYKEISRKLTEPPRRHIEREIHIEQEVKAFIKFNPHSVTDILDARNISSLTDNASLDYSFSFIEPFENTDYVVLAIGNGTVNFSVVRQTQNFIQVKINEPCPTIVRFEFRY